MIYCINRIKKETVAGQRTAGKKAPDDIARIIEKEFHGKVIPFYESNQNQSRIMKSVGGFIVNILNWNRLFVELKADDIVVIQHPYEGVKQGFKKIRECQKRGAKTVLFIHDIRMERTNIDKTEDSILRNMTQKSENESLRICDYIICHNQKMKKYLVDRGLDSEKIYCLNIFDYLAADHEIPPREYRREICVAGNLSEKKSAYLYHMLDHSGVVYNLYGPNYTGSNHSNINYKGVFPPDLLPDSLEGSFGLVWDGDDIHSCSGTAGEYLRINNPHKCSLYLASYMPVIIWKQAALAEFITNNNLGICVDSLEEIEKALSDVSEADYKTMLKNVQTIGKQIREGKHTQQVLSNLLDHIAHIK